MSEDRTHSVSTVGDSPTMRVASNFRSVSGRSSPPSVVVAGYKRIIATRSRRSSRSWHMRFRSSMRRRTFSHESKSPPTMRSVRSVARQV